jgi:hypothetical protein
VARLTHSWQRLYKQRCIASCAASWLWRHGSGDTRPAQRYKRSKYRRVKLLRCVQVVGKASFHFLGVTRPNRVSRHSAGLSRTLLGDAKREYLRIAFLIVPTAVPFQLASACSTSFYKPTTRRLSD